LIEKEDATAVLTKINEYWRSKVDIQLANACTLSTLEYGHMEELNVNIWVEKSKWKRERKPKQEYKFVE